MREDKDRTGKWLIDNHGDAILKLAKITGFIACAPPSPNSSHRAGFRMVCLKLLFPIRSCPTLSSLKSRRTLIAASLLRYSRRILNLGTDGARCYSRCHFACTSAERAGQVEQRMQESSRHGLTAEGF